MDQEYFQKLEKISMEISVYNKNNSVGNFHLVVCKDVEERIRNYQPLPKNRTKRSRYYKVKESNALKSSNNRHNDYELIGHELEKREKVKKIIDDMKRR